MLKIHEESNNAQVVLIMNILNLFSAKYFPIYK